MKKFIYNLITVVLLFSLLICSNGIGAAAAVSTDGYAVYRDGVAVIEWHAAIMNKPSADYSAPFVHATDDTTVGYGNWKKFLNGKTFQGVYKPITGLTNLQRSYVVSTARRLATDNIAYDFTCQINYSSDRYGKWVRTSDITTMRCDGVVEYVYEWNDIRIYGSIEKNLWNISWGGKDIQNHHSNFKITPKKQANEYMTLVTKDRPSGNNYNGYK